MSTTFQYRKKPVVIEAFQWTPEFVKAIEGTETLICPQWLMGAFVENEIKPSGVVSDMFLIHTLEGWMDLPLNHWVIRGVKGEIYSCAPEIFAATYDKVSA